MTPESTAPDLARLVRVYSDPLQHAVLAALVVAPLAARTRQRVLVTAVTAALVIDLDHVVAARSARPRDTTALSARPRTHSLLTAAGVGCVAWAAGGPAHGWAAFAALGRICSTTPATARRPRPCCGRGGRRVSSGGACSSPAPSRSPWAPPRPGGAQHALDVPPLLVLVALAQQLAREQRQADREHQLHRPLALEG